MMRFPHGDAFVVGLSGPDGIPDFWLSPATGAESRELHLAFRAPDRHAIDAVHDGFLAVSSGFGDQVSVLSAWRVDEGVVVSLAA